ncbi:MAG: HEPN domain-containing protein [Candidatus Acidulodesulfobacterium sp.]
MNNEHPAFKRKDKTVNLETGKIYQELMSLRNEADYDDFSEVTESEAKRAVEIARKFIKNIDKIRQSLIKQANK